MLGLLFVSATVLFTQGVGVWGLKGDGDATRQVLTAAGADFVATTLLETRAQLTEWLPVFEAESSAPVVDRTQEEERTGPAV